MDSKFLGIGLVNALGIAVFTMLFIIFLKTVLNIKPVEGLSELVNMA